MPSRSWFNVFEAVLWARGSKCRNGACPCPFSDSLKHFALHKHAVRYKKIKGNRREITSTMKHSSKKHPRRSIRLKEYDYSQAGAYFITVCTFNGKCLLGSVVNGIIKLSPAGKIVREFWFEIPKRFENVELAEFVVMPNHIHGVIIINNVGAIHELPLRDNKIMRRQMLIPKIVGFYKMTAAKHINQFRHTPGTPVWQRNYYEHVIRSEEDLNEIREYIINNPMKWELDEENPKNIRTRMR